MQTWLENTERGYMKAGEISEMSANNPRHEFNFGAFIRQTQHLNRLRRVCVFIVTPKKKSLVFFPLWSGM
jgi:hypothetical protein